MKSLLRGPGLLALALAAALPALGRGVCKVLQGIAVLGFVCAGPELGATTRYVDGGCPASASGNATLTACGVTNGPKRLISEGIAVTAAGDTLEIRGVHSHPAAGQDPGHANFDGRYSSGQELRVRNVSNRTIQPYGYTSQGTGELVYVDGTRPSANSWQQCVPDTSAGTGCLSPCTAVPSTVSCGNVWYVVADTSDLSGFETGSVGSSPSLQTGWGWPAYRVASMAELTNSHAEYVLGRCANASWLACSVDLDCQNLPRFGDGACDTTYATGKEIDFYRDTSINPIRIFANWGSWGPPAKPYLMYSTSGHGFSLNNQTGNDASGVTIRGLNIRMHMGNGVISSCQDDGSSTNPTFTDNIIAYNISTGSDSDYGISYTTGNADCGSATLPSATISNNVIAYTTSEAIHIQASPTGASALTITGNHIRDTGAYGIMAKENIGTPEGIVIGESAQNSGIADYSGTVISNNLLRKLSLRDDQNGQGIVFENSFTSTSTRPIIADNYIDGVEDECLYMKSARPSGHPVSDFDVYNNIILNCGGSSIKIVNESTATSDDITFFNNTVAGSGELLADTAASGTITNMIFKNNIFYGTGSTKPVNWAVVTASNSFLNNDVYAVGLADAGNVATWKGSTYTCDTLNEGDLDATDKCLLPGFINSSDYHLSGLTSPSGLIDLGTATGMPASKTTSINNSVYESGGIALYADGFPQGGAAWDMGATELMLSDGGFESGAFGTGKAQVDGACACTVATISNTYANGGTYSAKMVWEDCIDTLSSSCKGFYYDLTNLTVGETYQFQGDCYVPEAASGTYWEGRIFSVTSANPSCNFEATGSQCDICKIPVANCTGGWHPFSCTFYAEATSHRVRFRTQQSTDSWTLYLDNLKLRPLP